MEREEILREIEECGVIAVVRAKDSSSATKIAKAVCAGGVKPVEITMTVPGAIDVIKEVSHELKGKAIIGAGSVLDAETARIAILAGAEFIVGPALNLEMISLCKRYSKVSIPGAFTPTEIVTAWQAGADIVKIFPATLGGPVYFKDIHGPLPHIKLLPTGGVTLENAGEFIKAGACAIAVGSNLVDKKVVSEGKFEIITELAKKFVQEVKRARER